MKIFCKTFDSEVFGQVVVMRDFDEEKEKVKFKYMFCGAVQEISASFETEMDADKAFKLADLKQAENMLNPFIEFGMLDSLL